MRKHKVLLLGAGGMGRAWGKTLSTQPDVALTGWLDVVPGVAEQAAADLALRNVYFGRDLDAALHAVRPDFVIDVTPSSAHPDMVIRSLRYGVPVLGEKPMADSMEEAQRMVATAEQTGQLYAVSQNYRHHAHLRAYRRFIAQEIGPLGILNSDFYIGAHFGGYRLELEHLLLLDMAIHTFDAARYISGQDAVAVYCEEFKPAWDWFAGKASASAIFEMAGGLRYTYRGSWTGEGRSTAWDSEWRAIGPHGSVTWDGRDAIRADVVVGPPADGPAAIEPRTVPGDPTVRAGIEGTLRDFIQALETGATPLSECHDNIKSLAMVFAAIRSSDTGRRVPVTV